MGDRDLDRLVVALTHDREASESAGVSRLAYEGTRITSRLRTRPRVRILAAPFSGGLTIPETLLATADEVIE
jgi:hypothetical protein